MSIIEVKLVCASNEATSGKMFGIPFTVYFLPCQRSPPRTRIGWPSVTTGVRPMLY
jgi:hypothetical protein